LVEGRLLYDYVRGAHDDFDAAISDGLSWTFDRLAENEDLVRWMRRYNDGRPPEQKLHLYGMDVPGSPGNTDANRHLDTALVEALHFVARVEPAEAAALIQRCEPFLELLTEEVLKDDNGAGYLRLPDAQRDRLTSAINDLVCLFERREAQYIASSSEEDYSWAYRAAIGARQADMWMRCAPRAEQIAHAKAHDQLFLESRQTRDRAQADNISWIFEREGAKRKLIVFAHRYHLSTRPVADGGPGMNHQKAAAVAGTYLKNRFGRRLVSIGSLFGRGTYGEVGDWATLDQASRESLDGAAGKARASHYLLDVRSAPPSVQRWLDRPHRLAFGTWFNQVSSGHAFDIYHYIDLIGAVTPTKPAKSYDRDTNRHRRVSLLSAYLAHVNGPAGQASS
jgi:erythromycin esterase-like protein